MTGELELADLQAAAFVLARGFPLVRTEGPPYRKSFVFENVPPEVLSSFYSGQGQESARRLFDAYRTLRAIARQPLQEQERNRNHVSTNRN